ncbi:FecR family protein [Paenibacillus nanensis]|uniref:FecR family protein n=1 Tax=Paenibacillus nanensis TaxID=393251 RepID=UPI0013C2E5B6|nr:FecR domain-containing protein [Paenibacillus nanensis]
MKNNSIFSARGRHGLVLLACFLVLALVPASVFALASERSVTILEAKGDATVRLAGGQASFPAYAGMKLHEGDTLRTGAGAYAILMIDDRKDELTLGEHGELFLSDLKSQGKAAISRFTLLSGAIKAHVEERTGENAGERFEIRTPTAVMTAKGTHFLTIINKKTGETGMVVAAGVVRASTVTSSETEQARRNLQEIEHVLVYPAQQLNLDGRLQADDLRTKVEYVDIGQIVSQLPPKVIESLVKSTPDILKENEQIAEQLKKQLEAGITRAEGSTLLIQDADDLSKVGANFDNFIPNLAKEAIDQHKLEQFLIDEANKKVDDPAKKIDLTRVEKIDKAAGLDPEIEALKRAEQEGESRLLEEQSRLLENQQRLAALLQKVEADKKAIDEANRKAAEEAARKAEEQLKAKLDEASRKAFEESRTRNEQSSRPSGTVPSSPSPSTPPSNPDPGTDPGTDPDTDRERTLTLRNAVSNGRTVTANLYIGGFDQPEESIYAVEVHLLYERNRLSYHGKNLLPKSPNTVFGALPGSMEIIRQPFAWGDEASLYYAAVSDSSGARETQLHVSGEKLLVSIPLQLMTANDDDLTIKLAYYKVLDKDGNVLLDGSSLADDPITVAVQPAESR